MKKDRTECKERRRGSGEERDLAIFLYFPYPSGVIYGHRPPEHMIGWKMREEEVEGLSERGRVRGK